MFEVWFGGGIGSKPHILPPNWKWTNYTVFSSLPKAGVGVRIQGFIEIPNKQDIQEVNLPKILKETSIFYQHPPTNKKITKVWQIFCIYHSGLVSVISANLNPIVLLVSSRGRPSLGYKYHNHFLTFSNPEANKFYKSDNNRNSKFFEAGKIIFPTHNNIPIFTLSLCSIDVTPETSVITFNYHHHRIYFD